MDTREFIQELMASVRHHTDDAMKGTTVGQFNWPPPGTANTISAIFVHLVYSEDFFIQTILQGKPRIWEVGGWGERIGVKNPPGYGTNWDEFKHITLALEPVLDYQQKVHAATAAYLDGLLPEELGRVVPFGGGERTVADMIILLANHTASHAGEVAALKGIQGAKGLPY
jgi:hypothetical protein